MLDAATARQESATLTALGELSENLTALEAARRTEHLVATSLLPQADLTLPVGARRLRERQGGLRHAARRAAPDPPREAGTAEGAGRGAGASRRHRTHRGSRPMKTGIVAAAVAVVLAAVGGRILIGTRHAAPNAAATAARARRERAQGGAQDPLLPQSHGPARHLAGAEEGLDGHGLHRRSTRARSRGSDRLDESRSAPKRCRSWECEPKPPRCGTSTRAVRAAGRVQVDERRLHTVAPKFEGWIERLHVNTTGQAVTQGQPLMEVYSPELVSAQQEYADRPARRAGGARGRRRRRPGRACAARRVEPAAAAQLGHLEEQICSAAQRAARRSAPSPCVRRCAASCWKKPSIQGMRFMPGEVLYQIADLSTVWVLADVFEQDLGLRRQRPARAQP